MYIQSYLLPSCWQHTHVSGDIKHLHTMLSQLPLGASSESPLADWAPAPPETKGTQSGVLCGPCTRTLLHFQQPGSRSGVQGTGLLVVSFSWLLAVCLHWLMWVYSHVLEWSVSISALHNGNSWKKMDTNIYIALSSNSLWVECHVNSNKLPVGGVSCKQ